MMGDEAERGEEVGRGEGGRNPLFIEGDKGGASDSLSPQGNCRANASDVSVSNPMDRLIIL